MVEMVEKFLCPGCIHGCDTSCEKYTFNNDRCLSHRPGTFNGNFVKFNLGLPKGFNRFTEDGSIYLYDSVEKQENSFKLDIFNIPVWYTYIDEYLILKVFSPRICNTNVIVIKNAKIEDINIFNEGSLIEENSTNFNFDYKSIIYLNPELIDSID